jgi:uncharacterized protein YutE (UPF0331/DUF86 family)
LTNVRSHLALLREIRALGAESFRNDFRNHHAAMRLLQIGIEDMINVANHIIARRSYRAPSDFADAFRVLAEEKLISEADSGRYAGMARFRNRLVHVYWDVDLDQVFEFLCSDLDDFECFAESIGQVLLDENGRDQGN